MNGTLYISNAGPLTVLFRPVGPKELALIAAAQFRAFPPRLPEQPFFYPVLSESYARQIACKWNAQDSGAGYVTRFSLPESLVAKYPVRTVGTREHQELWVPAEDLAELNRQLTGPIEVIAEYLKT